MKYKGLLLSAVVMLCAFTLVGAQVTTPVAPAEPSKKANNRPAEITVNTPEPFDGATVEKMRDQCVSLETEAGVIDIEMIPEVAPESVRNFLNLAATGALEDRKSTRLNSSHSQISYAVFCL